MKRFLFPARSSRQTQARKSGHYSWLLTCSAATLLCSACSTPVKQWAPPPEKKTTYVFPLRQLPPQPVYSRVTEVRPPSVVPPRSVPQTRGPKILPVLQLQLKNVVLEEAAKVLAKSARYSYYCSSLVAKKTVSINSLGTIDELGNEIATKTGIEVIVDHENEEVRFLAGNLHPKAPQLP